MIKILNSADHHWDESGRFLECKAMHWWMVDVARSQGVGLFIGSGDLYERASTPKEREAVAEWLCAMAEVCPIILIRGNHDRSRDLAILAKLESKHPIIVEEGAAVHYVAGVAVACVAWPERAQLAAAFRGESSVGLDQVAQEQLRAVLRGLGEELAQHDGPKLGAGHFMVNGSVTSVGQPLRGHEMNVPLSDLALLRAPLVVMGHVHAPQQWTHDGCDIAYTGSPYRTTYGETEEKSVIVAEYSGCDLVGWKRIPTPCAPMFLATHTFGEHGFAGKDWQGLPSDLNDLHRAEIRLRYSVLADRQEEARAQVEQVKRALIDAGAADVKVDPQVIPLGTARAPKVATESSIEGKLLALWEARGNTPSVERAAELLSKAATLNVGPKPPAGGSVRLDSIRAKGVGDFRDELFVDFAAIDGQLVAVCGDNGSGKSTLLSLFPAAIFRDTPAHGSVVDLATSRDSFVEVMVENGQPWTIRQTADNVSRTGTSLVLDAACAPAFESTKVSAYDAWAIDHIQDPTIFYAGSFAAQRSRGFLDMGNAERKELLVQLLGLGRYEHQAEDAGARAKALKSQLDGQRARLADLVAPDLTAMEAALAAARARVAESEQSRSAARTALERAKAAAGDAARAADLAEQRRAAEQRLAAARGVVAGIEQRLADQQAVIARGDEIRAAVAKFADLEQHALTQRDTCSAAGLRAERAQAAERAASDKVTEAKQAVERALSQRGRVNARLADKEKIRAAVAQVEDLASVVLVTEEQIKGLEQRAAELEQLVLTGKDQRITGLRDGLMDIIGDAPDARVHAHATLIADDDLAAAALDAPGQLAEQRALLFQVRSRLDVERASLADAQRLAARAPEIDAAEKDRETADAELATAQAAIGPAGASLASAQTDLSAARVSAQVETAALGQLTAEIAATQPLLAQRKQLDDAAARIEEIKAGHGPAGEAVAAAERELAAHPVVDVATIDLGAYARAVTDAEAAQASAWDGLTRATSAVEQGNDTAAKRAGLIADIARDERELSDWTRLAQDLGKDGLQALEIDAALPEINALANNLLHSTLGSRFTVEMRTVRLSADGKKASEGLDFRVLDTLKGREADARKFSGGECVLTGEAGAWALTILGCRRAGAERPTIVRDESGAALDPVCGRAYVAMLRKAAREIGAAHVIYVSHTKELQELADARIFIEGGKVTVSQ